MLDRLLRKQDLAFSSVRRETGLERGANDIIEEEGAVNEETEASDLEPFERFPAQAQWDEPDEQRTAGIDCAARGSGDGAGDGETEEIETAILVSK